MAAGGIFTSDAPQTGSLVVGWSYGAHQQAKDHFSSLQISQMPAGGANPVQNFSSPNYYHNTVFTGLNEGIMCQYTATAIFVLADGSQS
jgi:hypothetical protein